MNRIGSGVKYRTVLLTAVIRSKTICSVPVSEHRNSIITDRTVNTGFRFVVWRPALCSEDDCWCLTNVERWERLL